MGRYNTRETIRKSSPAINPMFSRVCGELYFIIKWAFKNGIKEAYRDITGKVTTEDIEEEQIHDELGIDEEEK